jgi:hypothetical protein
LTAYCQRTGAAEGLAASVAGNSKGVLAMKQIVRALPAVLALLILMASSAFAPTEDDLSLATSAVCYAIGDTVAFTLTNNSDSVFGVPYCPPWSIGDAAAESLIYPSKVFQVLYYLGPHRSETYYWNQKDYHANQVTAGTYAVMVIGTLGELGPVVSAADTFDIGCAATVSHTWGRIKTNWK